MAIKAVPYTNFDGLLNAGVAEFLMNDNELVLCKNVWIYKVGKLEKVPGYTLAQNDQIVAGNDVNYLHHYHQPSTDTDYLLGASDSGTGYIIEKRTTGAWSSVTTHASRAGAQISITNYLDRAFIVGHDSGTFLPPARLLGTSYTEASGTDSNLLNMPQGKYIVRYRDLIYVLNARVSSVNYPNRAYYCDEPTAGAIGWTVATGFVSFGYDDGDEITGGVDALDRLLVFKHYSTWKYDESSSVKIADIGCDSYRSIVKVKDIPYWYGDNGIYRWSGDSPQRISAKVQPFFDAMDETAKGNTIGSIYNNEEYRLFIGTVVVDGVTFTNCSICFNTRTNKFYTRCTVDEVTSSCEYIEASKKRTYFGQANGYVMKYANKVDAVYSDNGNEIDSFFITKKLDHGIPYTLKFANTMTVFSNYATLMKVALKADSEVAFKQGSKSILTKDIDDIEFVINYKRGQYKFFEQSKNKSWEFEGFVLRTDIKEELDE